jgi:hypothetical protein
MEDPFPIKIRRKRLVTEMSIKENPSTTSHSTLIPLDQKSSIMQPPTCIRNRSIGDDNFIYFDYDAPINFTKMM